MRYEYSLIINEMPENPDNYTYKFGHMDNIQFSISENAFCIRQKAAMILSLLPFLL